MPDTFCPHCRGELVDDTTNDRWHITLVTPSSTASGFDTDTFAIDVLLSTQSPHQQALASNSGSTAGGYTTYEWTITRPGTPVSGIIEVDHDTLGVVTQVLTIS